VGSKTTIRIQNVDHLGFKEKQDMALVFSARTDKVKICPSRFKALHFDSLSYNGVWSTGRSKIHRAPQEVRRARSVHVQPGVLVPRVGLGACLHSQRTPTGSAVFRIHTITFHASLYFGSGSHPRFL
jgi:hypothetical protein